MTSNPRMAREIRVGNDVVDLSDPRSVGKAASRRFVRRVFSTEEARWIRESDDPDVALWVLWAAKETAFKVITKVLGTPPVFIHADFQCRPSHPDPESGGPWPTPANPPRPWGSVRWGDLEVDLALQKDSDLIHMVGWEAPDRTESPGTPQAEGGGGRSARSSPIRRWAVEPVPQEGREEDWEAFLAAHFSPAEARPIHSYPSAWVRLRARAEAATSLGLPDRRLELICGEGPKGRTPPRLEIRGRPAGMDVSLSHHGRFLAWVLGERT